MPRMRDCGRFDEIEWAVVTEPLSGQRISGDHWSVREVCRGVVLLAVADGLGHGPEAAGAARLVDEVLSLHPDAQPDELIRHCHGALAGSRGAAVAVARLVQDERCVGCAGVGNIYAGVIGARPGGAGMLANASPDAGIVGDHIPARIRIARLPVRVGDLFIMATDGVTDGVADLARLPLPIDEVAATLFDGAAQTDHDDALVLVGRIRGATR